MLGEINSASVFSTLKYNGNEVTDRFMTTTANQELVSFKDDGEYIRCNSLAIEAHIDNDIYFTIVHGGIKDPETHDFTGEPVLFCEAGQAMSIDGIEIKGIKLSNNLAAKLMVVGSVF